MEAKTKENQVKMDISMPFFSEFSSLWQVLTFVGAIAALAVMTAIAVAIGQIFHAVPDAAGGVPIDDYASILALLGPKIK